MEQQKLNANKLPAPKKGWDKFLAAILRMLPKWLPWSIEYNRKVYLPTIKIYPFEMLVVDYESHIYDFESSKGQDSIVCIAIRLDIILEYIKLPDGYFDCIKYSERSTKKRSYIIDHYKLNQRVYKLVQKYYNIQ